MSGSEIFNIVSGIITIASFLFAVWVWMKSDVKIKEISGVIRTIDDIAGTAIWEYHIAPARDYELRLRQVEKTIGFMASIQKLTERYTGNAKIIRDTSLGILLDKCVLWTISMLYDFEVSRKVTEIWIVSIDLKPDSSDEEVGKLINRNLRKGRRYIYFCPDDMPHRQNEELKLLKNLGVTGTKLNDRVKIVALNRKNFEELFSNGNIVLYFHDEKRSLQPRCFEEIIFTQVLERGAFWQEHSEQRASKIRHMLEPELKEAKE